MGPAIVTAAQGCDDKKGPCVNDGTGLAKALLGLPGLRVLEGREEPDELVVVVETIIEVQGCGECGTRALAHERRPTSIRDTKAEDGNWSTVAAGGPYPRCPTSSGRCWVSRSPGRSRRVVSD